MKYVIINNSDKNHLKAYNKNMDLINSSKEAIKDDNQFHFNLKQLDTFKDKMGKAFGSKWKDNNSPIQIISLSKLEMSFKKVKIEKQKRIKNIDEISDLCRKILGMPLKNHPIKDFFTNADLKDKNCILPGHLADRVKSRLGVEVFYTTPQNDPGDAYYFSVASVWIPQDHRPRIILSRKDSNETQRFALAHALGHLFLNWHWYPGKDLYNDSRTRSILKHQKNFLYIDKLSNLAC